MFQSAFPRRDSLVGAGEPIGVAGGQDQELVPGLPPPATAVRTGTEVAYVPRPRPFPSVPLVGTLGWVVIITVPTFPVAYAYGLRNGLQRQGRACLYSHSREWLHAAHTTHVTFVQINASVPVSSCWLLYHGTTISSAVPWRSHVRSGSTYGETDSRFS